MSSISDFFRGAAAAAPEAIRRADTLGLQARSLAIKEKASKLQEDTQKRLLENDKQAREMQSLKTTLTAMKNPNKAQQKAMIDFQVKNGDMTQDFADLLIKSSDSARAELMRRVADKEISTDDILFMRQNDMESLIPVFTAFENAKSKRAKEAQEERKLKGTQDILRGPAQTQAQVRPQRPVQAQPQLRPQGVAPAPTSPPMQQAQSQLSIDKEIQRLKGVRKQFLIAGNNSGAERAKQLIKLLGGDTGEQPIGNKFQKQIDALNQQAVKAGVGQVLGLTREKILAATGFKAGAFKFLAKAVGSFIPGEQAPKTQEAINDINLGNQQIIAGIALSKKFPIKEVERIQKFLVPGGKFFADPPFALRQYLALRNDFEAKNKGMLDAINSGSVTEEQTQDFIEKININKIALSFIPEKEALQSPKIFRDAQQTKRIEEETAFANNLTREEIKAMPGDAFRRLSPEARKVIRDRLAAEVNVSGSGVSGGF